MSDKFSLWKLVRLHWHMRKVKGGYREGGPAEISAAFVRAGIITEGERPIAEQDILQERLSVAFGKMAEHFRKERLR